MKTSMSRGFACGLSAIGMIVLPGVTLYATENQPACLIVKSGSMHADTVKLVRDRASDSTAAVGLYKAALAVNTDGAPTSYHPDDFRGERLALNRIDNGVSIRTVLGKKPSVAKQIEVFDQWRKGGWVTPTGYRITWKNVIAADPSGRPCIFEHENAGYFGSLSALKNGLSANQSGECLVKNQIDERLIPGIVLRGDNNPLTSWGAATGDLVLAINPETDVTVAGVVVDTGDGNRIGEGSVAMNMKLLEKTELPTNYTETKSLDTGSQRMIVAVVPHSAQYKLQRPYSPDNIAERLDEWAKEHYGSLEAFRSLVRACAADF
ncbi:hypothetical protein E2553_36015 [Paraburkholderia dipogonis]|uniref:Uncharacterized protein n=1 Tax=Paraburkholderia dipogonis TaxID=1211383 RepID=A0A4Y8MXA9_9BURK|nr:hypothetical protein [Paraburkholderia dipogonis]TFE42022.1 hypothetical protein E2553_36015 [Paraburkholderia dipogonis]